MNSFWKKLENCFKKTKKQKNEILTMKNTELMENENKIDENFTNNNQDQNQKPELKLEISVSNISNSQQHIIHSNPEYTRKIEPVPPKQKNTAIQPCLATRLEHCNTFPIDRQRRKRSPKYFKFDHKHIHRSKMDQLSFKE